MRGLPRARGARVRTHPWALRTWCLPSFRWTKLEVAKIYDAKTALGEASEHHEVGALDPGDAKALKGTIEGSEGQQRVFHGPVLALSSPGGILSGTDGSQVHTATEDLHLSAGES